MYDFDLLCIGSGPAGQRAAIQAAKLGKRVAVLEKQRVIGGVCIEKGTIPSKTFREAVRRFYSRPGLEASGQYQAKVRPTMAALVTHVARVIEREIENVNDALSRNDVEIIRGKASFIDPHTMLIESLDGGRKVTAENILLAVGTTPSEPPGMVCDGQTLITSDTVLNLDKLPRTMVVVGAGVIGIEYASMFAALGTKVTVVEKRHTMLDFCDPEIVEALQFHLRDLAVTFRFGEEVTAVDVGASGTVTTLASGKQIPAEAVLYSAGRQGQTEHLDLANAGLETDIRGRIVVDEQFRTKVDHIYAVGDVIGFPALAATSMEQGRLAANHAFGEPTAGMLELQPIGIYSIPEVSYVGATEVELTNDSIAYEVGVSRYRELARGQIAGACGGMLKLLVSPDDLKLLGVHIVGTNATELVHIGQAVMGCGGTLGYLVDAVFNYPTFAEAYKVAALDVMNKIRTLSRFQARSADA
jgi:NAD(P) transhydrogenase